MATLEDVQNHVIQQNIEMQAFIKELKAKNETLKTQLAETTQKYEHCRMLNEELTR